MNGRNHHLVVVVGCGRLGGLLAGRLSMSEREVVAIDAQERAFDVLPPECSGSRVTGDATEIGVLRSARS